MNFVVDMSSDESCGPAPSQETSPEEKTQHLADSLGVHPDDARVYLRLGGGIVSVAQAIFYEEVDRGLGVEPELDEMLLYDTHHHLGMSQTSGLSKRSGNSESESASGIATNSDTDSRGKLNSGGHYDAPAGETDQSKWPFFAAPRRIARQKTEADVEMAAASESTPESTNNFEYEHFMKSIWPAESGQLQDGWADQVLLPSREILIKQIDPAGRGTAGLLATFYGACLANDATCLKSGIVTIQGACVVIAEMLKRCALSEGGSKKCTVAYWEDGPFGNDLKKVGCDADEVLGVVESVLAPQLTERGSLALLLYSCVLSRGAEMVKQDLGFAALDIDHPSEDTLVGCNSGSWQCTSNLIGLLLKGVAQQGGCNFETNIGITVVSRPGLATRKHIFSAINPIVIMFDRDNFSLYWRSSPDSVSHRVHYPSPLTPCHEIPDISHLTLPPVYTTNFNQVSQQFPPIPSGTEINIVWFKCTDLRTHDQEALHAAHATGLPVLHLFIFDPQFYNSTTKHAKFPRVGSTRANFQLQCLADLASTLHANGHYLCVKRNTTSKDVFQQLAREFKIANVYSTKEVVQEEIQIQNDVRDVLSRTSAAKSDALKLYWTFELHHYEDLPEWIRENGTNTYTGYKEVFTKSSDVKCRALIPDPDWTKCKPVRWTHGDRIPQDVEELGLNPLPAPHASAELIWVGGERAAKERIKNYLWDTNSLALDYVGSTNSSREGNSAFAKRAMTRISPWLAHGCLSPRWLFKEILKYEQQRHA